MSLKPYKLASLKDKIEAIEEKRVEIEKTVEESTAEETKPRNKKKK